MKGFLKELIDYNEAVMFNVNQCDQKFVYNPVFHNRSKHIDTKFHYIREVVKSNKVFIYGYNVSRYIDQRTKPNMYFVQKL